MIALDTIDMSVLALLGKNGRATGTEISKELSEMHISLTDRAVLQRIARLHKKKTIQGYTTILHPDINAEKTSIILLLKFKTSANSTEIDKLNTYLSESRFCLSAARLEAAAGFDYICHLVFDTERQFYLQLLILRRAFEDLIFDQRIIKSRIVKQVPYTLSFDHLLEARRKRIPSAKLGLEVIKEIKNIEDKLQQFIDDLVRGFELKHVCLWLMEKSTDELLSVFHSDASGTDSAEYEYVSRSKIKIELMLDTKKPVLSNDIARDFNITAVNMLINEGVKSYGGYPLIHENQPIGILEIFGDRDLSSAEFELAEILSLELSDEIAIVL
ncbi:MAG TPA: GAF domain-containing protein [Nitrososphaeraceae archaeon]|nr:GAF domain-containing protein [Nitrososphaeraceae archaeon]